MIKAVIFDWGSVIAPDSGGGGWLGAFVQLLGLDIDSARQVWSYAYHGLNAGLITEDEFWTKVEGRLGKVLPESKHDIWQQGLVGDPWPEMLAYAQELRNNGFITAVLSNTVEPMFSLASQKRKVYADFYPVILSHEVGMAKPDPKIYELMLTKLALVSSDCIFVDDMQKNVDTAINLGMNGVLSDSVPANIIASIKQKLI